MQRGLRHDDDIFQGDTQGSSAAPADNVAGLGSGQVAAAIALLALGVLTIFRTTIGDILPD